MFLCRIRWLNRVPSRKLNLSEQLLRHGEFGSWVIVQFWSDRNFAEIPISVHFDTGSVGGGLFPARVRGPL